MDVRNVYTRVFFTEDNPEEIKLHWQCIRKNDLLGNRNAHRNFYFYLYSVIQLND